MIKAFKKEFPWSRMELGQLYDCRTGKPLARLKIDHTGNEIWSLSCGGYVRTVQEVEKNVPWNLIHNCREKDVPTLKELLGRFSWIRHDSYNILTDERVSQSIVKEEGHFTWLVRCNPKSIFGCQVTTFNQAVKAVNWQAWDDFMKDKTSEGDPRKILCSCRSENAPTKYLSTLFSDDPQKHWIKCPVRGFEGICGPLRASPKPFRGESWIYVEEGLDKGWRCKALKKVDKMKDATIWSSHLTQPLEDWAGAWGDVIMEHFFEPLTFEEENSKKVIPGPLGDDDYVELEMIAARMERK